MTVRAEVRPGRRSAHRRPARANPRSRRSKGAAVTTTDRWATEAEIDRKTIPADQLLMVWIAAANRDSEKFTDPDTFDPGRDPNPHLAFGRGIHFCVGASLARMEGRIATNLLLDRHPNLRCDPQEPPTFLPTPNMIGTSKLPLLLS